MLAAVAVVAVVAVVVVVVAAAAALSQDDVDARLVRRLQGLCLAQ